MEHNPFAPPSTTASQQGGLVFSPEGIAVVSSLASWMRGLSILYYLGVGLLVLGSCGVMMSGVPGLGMPVMIGFVIAAVLIGLAASWLRAAASGFERGVSGDDEYTLGQGFRSLRAFLIMFGIFGIIGLVNQIRVALEVL